MSRISLTVCFLLFLCHITSRPSCVWGAPLRLTRTLLVADSTTTPPTSPSTTTTSPTNNTTTTPTTPSPVNTTDVPTSTPAPTPTPVDATATNVTNTTTTTTTTTPTNMVNTTASSSTGGNDNTTTTETPTTVTPTTETPTTPAPTDAPTPTPTPTSSALVTSAPTPNSWTPTAVTPTSTPTDIPSTLPPTPSPTTSSPALGAGTSGSSSSTLSTVFSNDTIPYWAAGGGAFILILAIVCGCVIRRKLAIRRATRAAERFHSNKLAGVSVDKLDIPVDEEPLESSPQSPSTIPLDEKHGRASTQSKISNFDMSEQEPAMTEPAEVDGNIAGIRKRQSESKSERKRTRGASVQPTVAAIAETPETDIPSPPISTRPIDQKKAKINEAAQRNAQIESRRATPLPSYL